MATMDMKSFMIFHISQSNRETDHTSLGEFPFFAKGSMSSKRTFIPAAHIETEQSQQEHETLTGIA